MDLINATGMQAAYTMGMKPSGRELLVVAVKGTFVLPENGQLARLADEQEPLVMADTFTGDPGLSAPTHEADFAPIKHRCDVVLNGTAYTPGGKPATRLTVGLKVGPIQKAFDVVGDRVWMAGMTGIGPSKPQPFTEKPISYDVAFGGKDDFHEDEAHHDAYMPNPIGTGYHKELASQLVDGTPMPNTVERGVDISMPQQPYKPMSLGIIGRGWEPRYKLAGTYDQNWIDNVFPFLPSDFQESYYQCAPEDQQMDMIHGGEEVVLLNLTKDSRRTFQLPQVDVPIVFFPKKGDKHEVQAQADTLVIEPDAGRFTITWRAQIPLKRNMFEIAQVLAGKKSRGWWRARELGKTYYSSLADAVNAQGSDDEDLE